VLRAFGVVSLLYCSVEFGCRHQRSPRYAFAALSFAVESFTGVLRHLLRVVEQAVEDVGKSREV
jgi:hypothetical protein